jgi:hypothetical protein
LSSLFRLPRPWRLVVALGVVAIQLPLAASSNAQVLVQQSNGANTGYVTSLSNESNSKTPEEPAGPARPCGVGAAESNCFAADDFTIPPGAPWYLTDLFAEGQGGNGDSFAWVAEQGDAPPPTEEFGVSPFEFALDNGKPSVAGGTQTVDDGNVEASAIDQALPPGHYWLSVYAVGAATPPNSPPAAFSPPPSPWSWQTTSPLSGSPAVWASEQCGSSTAYKKLEACGQSGPDLGFRIEGEKIESDFSSLKLGRRERTPDGGMNIGVTLAGLPTREGLKIKKVSGKGSISTIVKLGWNLTSRGPRPGTYTPGAPLSGVVKIRPGSTKVANALRNGARFKMTLAVTYTREVESETKIDIPANTQTFKVSLKKKR